MKLYEDMHIHVHIHILNTYTCTCTHTYTYKCNDIHMHIRISMVVVGLGALFMQGLPTLAFSPHGRTSSWCSADLCAFLDRVDVTMMWRGRIDFFSHRNEKLLQKSTKVAKGLQCRGWTSISQLSSWFDQSLVVFLQSTNRAIENGFWNSEFAR